MNKPSDKKNARPSQATGYSKGQDRHSKSLAEQKNKRKISVESSDDTNSIDSSKRGKSSQSLRVCVHVVTKNYCLLKQNRLKLSFSKFSAKEKGFCSKGWLKLCFKLFISNLNNVRMWNDEVELLYLLNMVASVENHSYHAII